MTPHLPQSRRPAGISAIVLFHAMLARSLALALDLLLAPALAQTPASMQAQTAPSSPLDSAHGPAQMTVAQDHQRLMDLLGITELRPGVKQNGTGPDPVNLDESKANPWPDLPNPLLLNNGKPVTTAKVWWSQRRPEIVELFDHEYLGRVPANAPAVHWRVVSAAPGKEGPYATLAKHLTGHVDNSAYPALEVNIEGDLTLPANASPTHPVPIVIEFTFDTYPPASTRPPAANAPEPPTDPRPSWKQQVIAKGWGYALLYPKSFQADNGAGLTQGIIGLVNHGQPRQLDAWGALRAWAWGGSRLMDYLQTDPAVDAKHVAVEGHSRFGKAALVAMAYDTRFAVAYISSAGAGGSALARHRFGEQLENIAGTGEYHWMAGNYLKYAALKPKEVTPADLPIDTHELFALCAPRPVFVGGGSGPVDGKIMDGWADTEGSFLAEVAAAPVYRMLGKKGLTGPDGKPVTAYPPIGTAIVFGDLAFRQHTEGHTPAPNFPTFIEFASRYMESTPSAKKSIHPGE
jgi:hypothetical protein